MDSLLRSGDTRLHRARSLPDRSTLVSLLRWRARHQGNRIAYTFLLDGEREETRITYRELDRRARAIAAWLGHRLGERSAGCSGAVLLYPPGLEYLEAFFGCLYAGVPAVPAYPPRSNRPLTQLKAILADCSAPVILTTVALRAQIEGRLECAEVTPTIPIQPTEQIPSATAESWSEPEISAGTTAFIQYTSGSTGRPKGVVLSHANLLHNLDYIYRFFDHSPDSCVVFWLPFYHDMGLIGGVLQPLYGGLRTVLLSPLHVFQRPIRWLKAISRYSATTSGGPNFGYEMCIERTTAAERAGLDLDTWELAFNGAEPVRPATLKRFAETFRPHGFRRSAFYPCYGLAEGTLMATGGQKGADALVCGFDAAALERGRVVSSVARDSSRRDLVACGRPAADQILAIVDPETAEPCPPDRVGEIWISGPSVGGGYSGRPAETERTFGARLASHSDHFLRTGDLGFVYRGELFVAGRLRDLIIVDGRNLYPQDVEETVGSSHRAVRRGGVAAFPVDLGNAEGLGVAVEVERSLLPNRGRETGAEADGGADRSHRADAEAARQRRVRAAQRAVSKAVAEVHDARIDLLLLVKPGSLPKTSSGKTRRRECARRAQAGELVGLQS